MGQQRVTQVPNSPGFLTIPSAMTKLGEAMPFSVWVGQALYQLWKILASYWHYNIVANYRDDNKVNADRQEYQECVHIENLATNRPVKRARTRPTRIPRQESESYISYFRRRNFALQVAVNQRIKELCHEIGADDIIIESERLTCSFDSQSKLSQQELSDLQKATHFDKKELQQWYKGKQFDKYLYSTDADKL